METIHTGRKELSLSGLQRQLIQSDPLGADSKNGDDYRRIAAPYQRHPTLIDDMFLSASKQTDGLPDEHEKIRRHQRQSHSLRQRVGRYQIVQILGERCKPDQQAQTGKVDPEG